MSKSEPESRRWHRWPVAAAAAVTIPALTGAQTARARSPCG